MTATLASIRDLLSGEQAQQLVPIALASIAVFFMMLSLRRRQGQPRRPSREPVPQPRPQVSPELYRDLDELIVELQELSRRISAEIDTRFAKLETAIRDADRRIAVLHRLGRREDGAAIRPGSDPATDTDSRHVVVYELADAGFSPVEIARDLGKTPGEVELILNLRKTPEPSQPETGT